MQGVRLLPEYRRIPEGYGCNLLHLAHRGDDDLPGFPVARAKRETTDDLFSHLREGIGHVYFSCSVATALLYLGAPCLYHLFGDSSRHL